ncbi:hypothetical protein TNIN_472311 [Trichonephila inaurata madagascariensis]|uniref:Uncharacterized protein n=1 Tax=Trichonephila inaurata madagascariensis TaxID=2747483 RepID=A0A8X6XVQ1_9ARAC|nr:hypothetical protein TNIN_472311 [Trichonephila inaurata madagascariensis]
MVIPSSTKVLMSVNMRKYESREGRNPLFQGCKFIGQRSAGDRPLIGPFVTGPIVRDSFINSGEGPLPVITWRSGCHYPVNGLADS